MMQKQDKYLKMKKFSFPKLFQIFPKAVRTRTNKGSLIGQVIFKITCTMPIQKKSLTTISLFRELDFYLWSSVTCG
jgi:hypothetical protein